MKCFQALTLLSVVWNECVIFFFIKQRVACLTQFCTQSFSFALFNIYPESCLIFP